jgi:hypothetical protein
MTTKDEALRIALRALEEIDKHYMALTKRGHEAVAAIKEAQESAATVPDNSQNWAGMDGTTAWHLIERHADGWADVGKMMDEWLAANQQAQEPIGINGLTEAETSASMSVMGLSKPAPKQAEQEGCKLVPVEPTEAQWNGIARDMMMWLDMDGRHTAGSLFKHLERCGTEIPQWLRDEPEMRNLDHVPSKGTRVTIIYRAMLAAAPTPPEAK